MSIVWGKVPASKGEVCLRYGIPVIGIVFVGIVTVGIAVVETAVVGIATCSRVDSVWWKYSSLSDLIEKNE